MAGTSRYATFTLVDQLYGIEVEKIQEILSSQPMTPVPLAPPAVVGLVNLRGQISAVIEMRTRLLLPPRGDDDMPMNVVVRTGDGLVSLLVDQVGDVVDADEATFEPAPDALTGAARDLIRGSYQFGEKRLLALDVDETVDVNSKERDGAPESGGIATGRGRTRRSSADTTRP